MSYEAKVLEVMIASPSDVQAERDIVREVLYSWNDVHSRDRGVVLLPLGWDSHASPELGDRPQQFINERVLAHADVLVGVFWTRIGSPTGKSISGSVEEIERHVAVGKPVMLYFSDAPVQQSKLDIKQSEKLREFRAWAQSKGLVETFASADEFRRKFTKQFPIALTKNGYLKAAIEAKVSLAAVSDGAPSNAVTHAAIASVPGDPSRFISFDKPLCNVSGQSLFIPDGPCIYLRLLPTSRLQPLHRADALQLIRQGPLQLEPLYWQQGGASFEKNEQGAVSFCANWESGWALQGAQLFLSREIWAFDLVLATPRENRAPGLPWQAVEEAFRFCLPKYITFMTSKLGVGFPIELRAGAVGVRDYFLHYRSNSYAFDNPPVLLEDGFECVHQIRDDSPEAVQEALLKIFEKFFEAAGEYRPPNLYGFPGQP